MNASQRLTKELKSKVNSYKLYKIFSKWEPEEFGLVDRLMEERKRFETEKYGYYQNFNKKAAH